MRRRKALSSAASTGPARMRPLSWSVRIVCSPRPSEPITIRQPRSRIAGEAVMANSLANRWRLRSETISATTSTRTPWRRNMRTWDSIAPAAAARSSRLEARSMRAATICELPAMKLSRSMSSSTPTYSPLSVTATRRLLCLVILQQRARDEIVGLDRDDVVFRQSGDARLDRLALEDRRLGEPSCRSAGRRARRRARTARWS